MIKYEFSEHVFDMLKEYNVKETWVSLTIEDPLKKELKDDGTIHYYINTNALSNDSFS